MPISALVGKKHTLLKTLCVLNFNVAMVFLCCVSLLSASGSTLFFDNQTDLYGPMSDNLRLMLVYLMLTELAIYGFCHVTKHYKGIFIMGLFLLLLIVSVEFYGFINQVAVDENYRWLFLYLGLSHLGYGGLSPTARQSYD